MATSSLPAVPFANGPCYSLAVRLYLLAGAKVDVKTWLAELGLEDYAPAFAENDIDAATLPQLTAEDLKEIGVVSVGHRRRLLAAIAALAAEEQAPGPETGAAEGATPPGEQRQVTVLFADLAGFTALSAELGAEATHALLNRYFEAVDGVVAGYGGTIDKHMGDNVMAVFGAPVAHSDDPERAVRAAFDIHHAMAALSDAAGRALAAHIGIASGQVVASGTGSEAHREYTVTGDSVNLASRLQDKAEAGETLISEAVHGIVSHLVDCAPMGAVAVKGYEEPVRTWRLTTLRQDRAASRPGPFVGRRAERRQFAALTEDCLETGAGQTILVRGEAGIGKTRLVEELTGIAESKGFATHRGLVLDFGVGKGQDAVRSLVRSLLGIAPGGGEAARGAAAKRAIEAAWLAPDQRVFLNDLLDLPQPLALRGLYDAMDNATRNLGKQEAVAALIANSSGDHPLLIAIEDIHWADALTLEHLAAMATACANSRTILIMTTRVEGDPLDQAWRARLRGSPLTTIDLQPLRAEEARKLARGFAEASSTVLRQCIERAEGNPLFLEQLLRNAAEGAVNQLPGSIQSLVQARMDRLDPPDKRALQAASVVGQRFSLDALRHLLDDETYDCAALVAQYLVRPEAGDHLFAHALVREGVYTSLLRQDKQALHRRAAAWFSPEDPVLRAEHLARAEDEAAPRAYLDAARWQTGNYHYEKALELVARGLALAIRRDDKFALTCSQGQILHDLGSIPESLDASRAALDLAGDDAERCRAYLSLAAGMRIVDDYERAFDALDSAESLARRHDLAETLAQIHHLRGNINFPLGRIERCLEEHGESLVQARRSGSPEAEAEALGGLGDAEYARGRMASAHGHFSRCVALCREHGFGRIEVANRTMEGHCQLYIEGPQRSLDMCLVAAAAAAEIGHHRAELNALLSVFFAQVELGRAEEAAPHFERSFELVRLLGARRFECTTLGWQARAYLDLGQRELALARAKQAFDLSLETGVGFNGPRVLSVIALASGDRAERQKALSEGEKYLEQGAIGHNHLFFYRDAIDVSLAERDWPEVERYAAALESYTRAEPLAWSEFAIARGHALAAFAQGARDQATVSALRRLREEAQQRGLMTSSPAIEDALAAA